MESKDENEMEWSNEVSAYFSDHRDLDAAANAVMNDLVDAIILGVVFEVHKAAKIGYLDSEDSVIDGANNFYIVDEACVDVFGQKRVKKITPQRCVCPSCNRNLAAQIFAPHLSKCMGMGRNSARLACQRITNISQENIDRLDVPDVSKPRKKRYMSGKRFNKNQKNKNNEIENVLGKSALSELMDSDSSYESVPQSQAVQSSNVTHSNDIIQVYEEPYENEEEETSNSPLSWKQDNSKQSDLWSSASGSSSKGCTILKLTKGARKFM